MERHQKGAESVRWRDRLINVLITVAEYMLWLHYPWDLFWWATGRYKLGQRYVQLICWLESKWTFDKESEASGDADS